MYATSIPGALFAIATIVLLAAGAVADANDARPSRDERVRFSGKPSTLHRGPSPRRRRDA